MFQGFSELNLLMIMKKVFNDSQEINIFFSFHLMRDFASLFLSLSLTQHASSRSKFLVTQSHLVLHIFFCLVNMQAEAAQSQNTAVESRNRATVPSVSKGQSQAVGVSRISKEV